MHLSELQTKEIINISDGKKLGKIIDVEINNDKIVNLIIEERKNIFNFFRKNQEILLNWHMIEKIGEDVILVKDNINENK